MERRQSSYFSLLGFVGLSLLSASGNADDETAGGAEREAVVPPPIQACTGTPVRVTQDGARFTLDNGDVQAIVDTSNATLPSFIFRGVEMMSVGGYYSFGTNIFTAGPFTGRLVVDPETNGGEVAEISMTTSWGGGAGVVPLDIDVRYALTRCSRGVYEYVGLTHPEHYPAFNPGEMRINHYVRWDDVFDWYAVDDVRRGPFPSQADVAIGATIPGAPVEVRQYFSGPFAHLPGWQKYDVTIAWGEGNVYGWSSTSEHMGLWIVNPVSEYLAGGPLKTELTVHDGGVGRGALLNYWGGTHFYGGFEPVLDNQRREKVMGPWLLYANETELPGQEGHDALWSDAKDQLVREREQWPYSWESDPRYLPEASRGSVSGAISFSDTEQPTLTSAYAWVGLAGRPVAGAPNFEHQGWDYQYWTVADANGKFSLENVRPGGYTLHAFAEGIHGVYMGEPDAVRVNAGAAVELGDVAWNADRLGPTVWELGRPDRTPREFYRGDRAWQYGTNLLFLKDFPNGVDFVVGTSDPGKDWNYLQPGGTWTLRFNLEDIPAGVAGASLILDVAGSDGVTVNANLNGTPIGTAEFLYRDGSISRDQPHGVLQSERLTIDVAQLMSGENTLELTSSLRLMWDYIRLEWVTG